MTNSPLPTAHAPDFSAVVWRGTVYTFTPTQRAIVAALWRAMEDGYHFVSGDSLMEQSGSEGRRVLDIFRAGSTGRHPAWNTFILTAAVHGRHNFFRLDPGGVS